MLVSKKPVVVNGWEFENIFDFDVFLDSLNIFRLESEPDFFLIFKIKLIMILIVFEEFNENGFSPVLIKVHVRANVVNIEFGRGIVDTQHLETVGEVILYLKCMELVLDHHRFQA